MISTACHKPITWERTKAQRRCKLNLQATRVLGEEGWEETKEKGLQVTSSLLLLAIARLKTVELLVVKNTPKVIKTVILD